MALFGRKKNVKPVTKEVEKYIKAERRERAGLAWLLALISLAVVSLFFIGIFFGSRWAYNRYFKDDKGTSSQVAQNSEAESAKEDTESQEQATSESQAEEQETPTAADTEESEDVESEDTEDTEEMPASLPATGSNTQFSIAAIIAVISTVAYSLRLRKRLN